MVIVRKIASRWFRRYRVFVIFGITILLFHIVLTLKFFSISKNTKEQVWQPIEENTRVMKLPIQSKHKDIKTKVVHTKTKFHLNLKNLNFKPNCDINGLEAISAINRAESEKCKQFIANVTCLSKEMKLYPYELPNFCLDETNNTGRALGCFKDEKHNRILNGFHKVLSKDNSPNNCLLLCLQYGFPFTGTEFSNLCFCGLDKPSPNRKLPDSSCNMKCPGKEHQICGGHYAINVYHTGIKKFSPKETFIQDSKPVRIVFLLTLNGRALRQITRLLKLIYNKDHFYYIHVDVRQDYLFRNLLFLEKRFSNIKLSQKRYATIWGGASLLTMLRSCMNDLLHLNWDWDFVLNLSESDYPVKTIDKLTEFLTNNRDRNFVKSHGREVERFIQKQGLDKTFVECDMHMWRVGDRKLPWGIQIDGGSDWIALNREFVEYVAGDQLDELVTGLLKVYRYTLLPAESFFHTVLKNSIFCNTYIDNNLHVTNWKRKLGCKCQYKHVVDWCGCSPNDFKPEDWPKILGTEMRQVYFARKFEPVISQSVIYKLELWLMGLQKSRIPLISIDSYWQNVYHYEDLEPVPSALLTISESAVRNWLKPFHNTSCVPKNKKILEIITYHYKDSYKYTLVKLKFFELAFNNINTLSISKSTPLTNRLKYLSVNSDYDEKEQMSRNFAQALTPYSDLVLMYQFSSDTSNNLYNISFLWIEPTGKLIEVTDLILNDNNLNGHSKIDLPQPHKPGTWYVKMVHKNTLIAELKFLIIPVEFSKSVINFKPTLSQSNYSHKTFDETFNKFLIGVPKENILEITGTNVKRKDSIDKLFSEFYEIKNVCSVEDNLMCDQILINCLNATWSSYYPDPKSAINHLNQTNEMFDLWL